VRCWSCFPATFLKIVVLGRLVYRLLERRRPEKIAEIKVDKVHLELLQFRCIVLFVLKFRECFCP